MTHLEWFEADKITAAGYAGGETAADGQKVDAGRLAVEIEGHVGTGAIFEGTKSELLRFATDIIEATLIAEHRAKDKRLRLQMLQNTEAGVEQLKAQAHAMTLTPEQHASLMAGTIGVMSIRDADLRENIAAGMINDYSIAEPASMELTPEQAAAFKAGEAGWDLAGAAAQAGMIGGMSTGKARAAADYPTATEVDQALRASRRDKQIRDAAIAGTGKIGRYTIAELQAMPMDEYLAACTDILGLAPDEQE